MQQILSVLTTALQFLVIITVLVAIHELGHLWVARLCGMRVKAFAVMMGGVRKTDLRPYLRGRLAPAWTVWLAGAGATGLFVAGGLSNSKVLLETGLALLAVAIPVWVVTRLCSLYHRPAGEGLKTLALATVAGIGMTLFGTGFRAPETSLLLGVLVATNWIGAIVVYYAPLNAKSDEEEMGHGAVMIRGERTEVRFRPVWARTDKHGTEYSLLVWPMGGFASIEGMHPKEDGSEVKIPMGFYSKSPLARLAVLFAGPLFSIVFGVAILVGLFTLVGRMEPSMKPVVGTVAPNSGAAKAGLKAGDTLVSINGQSIGEWKDVLRVMQGRDAAPVTVVYRREGATEQTVQVTPQMMQLPKLDTNLEPVGGETENRAALGLGASVEMQRMDFLEANREAWMQPVVLVRGLVGMIVRPQTASENIGGPVSIARVTHSASNEGLYGLLFLAGMLSLSLGVMNLLPVPPLDGGQMVINFIELLRGGKRLGIDAQRVAGQIGFFLMLLLMVSASTLDIGRLANGQQSGAASNAESASPQTPDTQDAPALEVPDVP